MKSIKKLKSTGKAVAGSALLVGATLTGAAGLASAQDSGSMDLGDYPTPFVNEDGEVDSTIVVGEQAQTADVVGAINVAGSLGNAAFMEEEVSVDVSGAVASWSADNGVTLNRQNSNLFLDDATDSEISRIDADDVNALEETEFSSADNNDVAIEHEVTVGDQDQDFSPAGDLDDPILHLNVPYSGVDTDAENHLMMASVEFSEALDFTEAGEDAEEADTDADEWIEDGDTIELFGNEYAFSDESDNSELVLYGSSDRFEVNTGESDTVTVDGEEHEFEAQYVSDTTPREATITVDGTTEAVEEGDTVSVSGQDVRVSDIYRTGADGEGRVAFSIGSEELVITDNNEVEIDGDEVDGVYVNVESEDDTFEAVTQIDFAFGAQDNEENYIEAGEAYEDPVFGLEFHYGGLAPNAAEDASETIEVESEDEEESTISFTGASGDEADVTFSAENGNFGDDDGEIAEYEGEAVEEDDFVVLNSNEEAGIYEVTDTDTADIGEDDDGEVSVTLENLHTGDSITVEEDGLEIDGSNNDGDLTDGDVVLEDESIDGMDFDVTLADNGEVSFVRSSDEGTTQIFPSVYTETDGAVAFADDTTGVNLNNALGDVVDTDFTSDLDSTVTGTDDAGTDRVAVYAEDSEGNELSGDYDVILADDDGNTVTVDYDTVTDGVQDVDVSTDLTDSEVHTAGVQGYEGEVTVYVDSTYGDTGTAVDEASVTRDAEVTRTAEMPSGIASNDADVTWTFTDSVDYDAASMDVPQFVQYTPSVDGNDLTIDEGDDEHKALFVQPEDDNDEEHAYVWDVDASADGNVEATYTGTEYTDDMDSEDNLNVGYNVYGTYTEHDTDDGDNEVFTADIPAAQSTAGMAVTGADGSLSASAGGSGSATTQSATGWPGATALDTEVSGSDRDQNMILVGGPAVNTLTEELAQDNKTWTGDDYEEDTWVLDLVEGFSEDTHALVVAGHSAEDTRAASSYISNYADNEDELAGETTVSMTTSASQ